MDDKQYILIWNGVAGKVLADGDTLFDITERPRLSFNYQNLYVDTVQGQSYLVTGTTDKDVKSLNIELDPSQLEEVKTYCDNFKATQDYLVQTYDAEYIWRGGMLKSEADSLGLNYVLTEGPTNPFSKYSTKDACWYPVFAAFKEDGYPVFDQGRPMDNDIMFLTEKEWSALPKQPSSVYSLNFVTMTWEDVRDLDRVKFDAIMDVRTYFEHDAMREEGYIRSNEVATYQIQYAEAEAYLKNKEALTPFIDGFLSVNEGQDKKALCERIMDDYSPVKLHAAGKLHGEMYNYIYRIKACKINAAVDKIVQEVYASRGKYRILNIYRRYPADFAKQVATGTELAIFAGGSMYHTRESN